MKEPCSVRGFPPGMQRSHIFDPYKVFPRPAEVSRLAKRDSGLFKSDSPQGMLLRSNDPMRPISRDECAGNSLDIFERVNGIGCSRRSRDGEELGVYLSIPDCQGPTRLGGRVDGVASLSFIDVESAGLVQYLALSTDSSTHESPSNEAEVLVFR